jgi:hypothetical protein
MVHRKQALVSAIPTGFPDPRQRGLPADVAACGLGYAKTSFIAAGLAFRARYAARRYSLIKPPRTCLRLIRALISKARPGGCGGSWRRL